MINTSAAPSNRSFGLFFGGAFAALAAYQAFLGRDAFLVYGLLICAAVFALLSLAAPQLLTPFNRAWMKLGDLMGRVGSPVVLGIIFFVLITPIAIFARKLGRDELRLKRPSTGSYWIDRQPPGPTGDSFTNQYFMCC